MKPNVKTLLFGDPHECRMVGETLNQTPAFLDHIHEYRHIDDLEEFDKLMASWMPSLIVVLADGAAGMESVYRSRQRHPDLPVFWFSGDREFSMQSYRLDCAFFATKPVTAEKIAHAVHRCHHVGIRLTVDG